jgi:hypothetical protein
MTSPLSRKAKVRFTQYKSQLSQDTAASSKMQSISSVLIRDLSIEARTFRWLVRGFVAAKLREDGLSPPVSLLMQDQQVTVDDQELVSKQDLQEAFYRCVNKFISDNDGTLQTLVDGLPPTSWTIGECIVEVNRNVLLLGDVSWGRMVAIAAFLAKVSVRCINKELSEAIVPLIDQAALQVNEKLAAYIRDNGGWTAFALAFKSPSPKKEGSWAKKALSAVSVIFAVYEQLYFM